MNVLLTGASGFVGRNIATVLTAKGHRVIPVSRLEGVDFAQMLEAEKWLPYLEGVDAVINSVGIIGESGSQNFAALHTHAPIALFEACSQAGVRRVVQISALGADETAFSAFHLSKRAADDYLCGLDLEWFVLRPSLIYGRGGKSAELFMRLAALPLIPVIGDGEQTLQPLHISDVVTTVLQALTSTKTGMSLDIVGAETFTFTEWLQMMRHAQRLSRARVLHVPAVMAMVSAYVGRYFNPMLQPENLLMLQRGYRTDSRHCEKLEQFIGRPPLNVESHLFFSDVESIGGSS
ncbi:epimerase [Solemya pervernicosa gill symbiont]|uniref:Epimerase n=1 Tax=Solemya pervernicosa gill symbiont TaxID=642797 RepID=A0A1T2L1J8_9GAMM|nr:NAD-dependent epimerase/dehydratase family protein [Solemya pervernicosa gill symbiont]OOZ38951.1 epimerase [Solemya pervernicosa gill symbiont]